MLGKKLILLFLVFSMMSELAHARYLFQDVKKQAKSIWLQNPETLYCGCKFDKQLTVVLKSCGYVPGDRRKASKVEWEHLVPVSWFGRQRPCWREALCKKKNGQIYKGRKCCERTDLEFRNMLFDLHNLVPIIGEVNQARSNFRFAELSDKDGEQKYNFHGCKIIIDRRLRAVEPREEVKGLVARAHLYMADTYHVNLSKNQKKMFIRWNNSFAPSEWEIKWNNLIKCHQGTDNRFISEYYQTSRLLKKVC